MKLQFSKQVRVSDTLRGAYNALTEQTYGFSFEDWYRSGWWGDSHIPYTLFDGDRAAANVSANRMELLCNGVVRPCIQLGTVMTGPKYRNQGLSRRLMEEVLRDCQGQTVFLFANETVLDFYPKFGFRRKPQYQFSLELNRAEGLGQKLDMGSPRDRELLLSCYKKQNPFSKIQAVNGESLLMFYCAASMKDCVRYLPEFNAVAVAEQEDGVLHCYDVYCDEGQSLPDILAAIAAPGTRTACLAFTPRDASPFQTRLLQDGDDALFVLEGTGDGLFDWEPLLFPVISHT